MLYMRCHLALLLSYTWCKEAKPFYLHKWLIRVLLKNQSFFFNFAEIAGVLTNSGGYLNLASNIVAAPSSLLLSCEVLHMRNGTCLNLP